MMSGADLFEDGFPHSTVAGYRRGCQGRACPGVVENGISCAETFQRYQGDYGFRKRVDAGMSATEIVAEEKLAPKPRPSVKREERRPLAEFGDDFPDAAETPKVAEAVEQVEETVDGIPLLLHGTPQGYWKGCRLKDRCPGWATVGKSCTEAVAEYQRARKAAVKTPSVAEAGSGTVEAAPAAVAADTVEVAAEVAGPEIVAEAAVKPDEVFLTMDGWEASAARIADLEARLHRREEENAKLLSLTGEQTDTILELRDQFEQVTAALEDLTASEPERPAVEVVQTSLGEARQLSITITLGGAI